MTSGWSIFVALVCVLLAAKLSRWHRRTGQAATGTAAAAASQTSEKKKLWIRRDPPATKEEPDVGGSMAERRGGGGGGGGGGDGLTMPTEEQLKDLLSQAQSHLTDQDGSDGEAQVKAAMAALAAVRGVMAAQGRTEEEVMQALQAAAADNRQVVASDTRPGPNWQPLLPQDLGAEASLLSETGRGGIIGDAAVDPESYVCPKCGGVVARRRRAAHDEYWCGPADDDGDDSDEGAAGEGARSSEPEPE
jgi:hypothetical protein